MIPQFRKKAVDTRHLCKMPIAPYQLEWYKQASRNPANTNVETGRADSKGSQPQLPLSNPDVFSTHTYWAFGGIYTSSCSWQKWKEGIWADKDVFLLGSANELSADIFGLGLLQIPRIRYIF